MKVVVVALALLGGCVRVGFGPRPTDDASGDHGATDIGSLDVQRDGVAPGGDGQPASPDATRITGQTDCKTPVLVDMAQQPVILELDFSGAGCPVPGLTLCNCALSRQHVVRLINAQAGDLKLGCTGDTKIWVYSKGSSQCPPASPKEASIGCSLKTEVSHGYGDYLIVCRRQSHAPVISLELRFK